MPVLVGNPQRRTHKKSKLGCSNCKDRHIRCDEKWPVCTYCLNRGFDCRMPSQTSPQRLSGRPNLQNACNAALDVSEARIAIATSPYAVDLEPLRHCLDTHGLPVEWSNVESRLMYGFVQVCRQMQRANGHLLSLGTSILPIFLRISFHYEYARYAVLNMLTMQLAHLRKSSHFQLLTQYYRTKAFGTLAIALNDFKKENADAILVTSVNLAYTSTGEKEHKHLENGVSTVIAKMQPYKDESKLPQYFRGPHSLVHPPAHGQSIRPKPTTITAEVSHAILHGLEQTKALFGRQKAFQAATQNLWLVIYNVSDGRQQSMKQQYETQDALRALKFVGIEFLADMGKATPTELVLMAYQELVMLIVQELRPDTSWAYFILAKADVIVCIHDRLMEKLAAESLGLDSVLYRSIIHVPYDIAVTYQKHGRIALS